MSNIFLWPDLLTLGFIVISIVISFFRGFLKELISLATWILAAWLAYIASKQLAPFITFVEMESLRLIIAFGVVFIVTIFLGALVNFIVGRIIRRTPFSVPDRFLGIGFGLIRGLALVTLIIFFLGLTPAPQDDWWQKSLTISKLEVWAIWIKERLPEDIGKHFNFEHDNNNNHKV